VITGPGDEAAAGAGDHGHLRAAHTDREQVLGILKAAFVQGRLDRDEFDLRVSQALASRTYAELSAVTADLPPGLAAAKPPAPARVQNNRGVLRPVVALTVATAVYAGTWPVALSLPVSGPDHDPHAGVALAGTAFIVYLIFLVVTVMVLIDSRQQRRSGKQLPPGSAPGAGGPASPRLPAPGPDHQLPTSEPGRPYTAEASRKRRPHPPLPVRRHCASTG
jgi:hypothetical protein